jgi:hypothetical protein
VSITVVENAVIILNLLIEFVDPTTDSVRLFRHFKLCAVNILDLGITKQVMCIGIRQFLLGYSLIIKIHF